MVKRWQGDTGWVGVTDGVTSRRLDLELDQRLNKMNNIDDDLAHLELHPLPNLGTAFLYRCYILKQC